MSWQIRLKRSATAIQRFAADEVRPRWLFIGRKTQDFTSDRDGYARCEDLKWRGRRIGLATMGATFCI